MFMNSILRFIQSIVSPSVYTTSIVSLSVCTTSIVSLSVCTTSIVSPTPTFQLHVFEQPLVPACYK